MTMAGLWNVAPCVILYIDRRFTENYCLCHPNDIQCSIPEDNRHRTGRQNVAPHVNIMYVLTVV